jgi:hypothetical protein
MIAPDVAKCFIFKEEKRSIYLGWRYKTSKKPKKCQKKALICNRSPHVN